ncbi:hypothetical protein NUACC21_69780 [Scytonema sp. NUACC21]
MNLEEALKVADEAVFNKTGKYLTDIQKLVLQECWDKKTYDEIAKAIDYSPQHIKNEGNELWKLLTNALGEKVSKSNFQAPLERYQRRLQKSEENVVPRTLPVSPTCNSEKEIDAWVQEVRKKVKPYYEKRYGILKVLGMREPVKLESVYTAVQFLDNEAIRSFESIENLEKFYRQANRRSFQFQDEGKQEGIIVANDKQYLMVLGGPGAGKSTFLRKVGLEALKAKKVEFKHTCIPVFLELKTFTSNDIDIEKIIAEEFRRCGVLSTDEFTGKALETGKLLILLDGLDEVPTQNLNQVISKIEKFVDTYDQNRFIASCRTAAYRSSFRCFNDVAMADFDDIQIQQFIYNWFQSAADKQAKTGEKCWELLQKPENSAAKELAHTPLLRLVPVEANASGTPVIAFGAGGVLDTQIPGKTGVFFKRQTPDSLQTALLEAREIYWDYGNIRNHAVTHFSEEAFFSKVDQVIDQACAVK